MQVFRKTVILVSIFSVGWISAPGLAASPMSTLKNTVNTITSTLKSNKSKAQKKEALADIYYKSFDVRLLAQRTLRNLWKTKLNKAQQKEFTKKFGKFILVYYLSKMESYNNNKVEFASEKLRSKKAAVVSTRVEYNGKMGKVDYLMRARSDNWYIYDVEIEGIMLSTTYRQQFAEILAGSGYDAMMKELDKLIKKYD